MTGAVKALPSTAPAAIGTAVHEGTAVYDQSVIDHSGITIDEAAGTVVENIWNPQDEVRWRNISQKDAERRALGVFTRYCNDVAPTIKYECVEMPLTSLVIDVEGVEIELTGTLDRVYSKFEQYGTIEPGRGILDIKTGVNACSAKPEKHVAQIGVYELLAEFTTGQTMTLPGLIGQLQTSNEYKVGVAPVVNAKNVLLGMPDQTGLLGYIAKMLDSGDWIGNVSSWLCSADYCPLYNECFFMGKL